MESFLQSLNRRDIELNHQQIVYEENYITLAWKIIPNNCSVSQTSSYAPCQQTNAHFNITTNETKVTLSSESFNDQITGELIDFDILSLSDQPSDDCHGLLDTVRFNGKLNPQLLRITFYSNLLHAIPPYKDNTFEITHNILTKVHMHRTACP